MEQSTTSFELYREGLDVAVAIHSLNLMLMSNGYKTVISSLQDYGIVVTTTTTTKGVPGFIELSEVLMKYLCSSSTPPIFKTRRFRPEPSPIEPETHGLALGFAFPMANGQTTRELLDMIGKLADLGRTHSKPTTSDDSLITWNPGALKGTSEELRPVSPFEGTPISQAAQFDSPRYVVWNADKSIGFITTDWQLAYEARKGSDTNCYSEKLNGLCKTAVGFCEDTGEEDCTMEELVSFTTQPPKKPTK